MTFINKTLLLYPSQYTIFIFASMRSSICSFSASKALYRIFIAPIEHSALRLPHQTQLAFAPSTSQLPLKRLPQRNYASFTPILKSRLPCDEEITSPLIHLVTPDGKLSSPQPPEDILSTLDRQTQTLVTVSVASDSPSDSKPSYPICRIIAKKTLYESQKAKSKSKSSKKKENPSKIVKTLELNWAIDAHDLKHRLERVREFLEKGFRVDVVMAGKKKGRRASVEEAERLVRQVRALVEGCGGREWKAMDGQAGGSAVLYAEGRAVDNKEKEEEQE